MAKKVIEGYIPEEATHETLIANKLGEFEFFAQDYSIRARQSRLFPKKVKITVEVEEEK